MGNTSSLLFLLPSPVSNAFGAFLVPDAMEGGTAHTPQGSVDTGPAFEALSVQWLRKTNSHYSEDTGECHGKGTGSGKNRVQTLALPLTKYMGLS